jgi:hypothetical protein
MNAPTFWIIGRQHCVPCGVVWRMVRAAEAEAPPCPGCGGAMVPGCGDEGDYRNRTRSAAMPAASSASGSCPSSR